jgi:hypothetical protein
MSRYIYETKGVSSGRTTKRCSSCRKTINAGEPSITIVCFSDEFYNESVCSDKCSEIFHENFDKPEDEE